MQPFKPGTTQESRTRLPPYLKKNIRRNYLVRKQKYVFATYLCKFGGQLVWHSLEVAINIKFFAAAAIRRPSNPELPYCTFNSFKYWCYFSTNNFIPSHPFTLPTKQNIVLSTYHLLTSYLCQISFMYILNMVFFTFFLYKSLCFHLIRSRFIVYNFIEYVSTSNKIVFKSMLSVFCTYLCPFVYLFHNYYTCLCKFNWNRRCFKVKTDIFSYPSRARYSPSG